jgi:hypothetical protein
MAASAVRCRSLRSRASATLEVNCLSGSNNLHVAVRLWSLKPELAAETRLLVTAKRIVARQVFVLAGPYIARLQLRRHRFQLRGVLTPNRPAQVIACVIGVSILTTSPRSFDSLFSLASFRSRSNAPYCSVNAWISHWDVASERPFSAVNSAMSSAGFSRISQRSFPTSPCARQTTPHSRRETCRGWP